MTCIFLCIFLETLKIWISKNMKLNSMKVFCQCSLTATQKFKNGLFQKKSKQGCCRDGILRGIEKIERGNSRGQLKRKLNFQGWLWVLVFGLGILWNMSFHSFSSVYFCSVLHGFVAKFLAQYIGSFFALCSRGRSNIWKQNLYNVLYVCNHKQQ